METENDTPAGPPEGTPAPPPNPLQAEVDKWKGLSRKHEQSWQQAQATITDLQAQLSAKDNDLQSRDADLLRFRVGLAQGVPVNLIDRLKGSTEQELLDDAKGLLDAMPTPTPAPTGAPPPTPITPDPPTQSEAFAEFFGSALNS